MRDNMTLETTSPLPAETEKRVKHVEALAKRLDSQFSVPGTQFQLGLDAIIGLIPGIGDTLSLCIAGYIVLQAQRLGARKRTLIGMTYNIFIDWLIGLVPIIGDIFDMGWKGNNKNAALLRAAMEKLHGERNQA